MPPSKVPYLSAAFRGKQLSQEPSAAGLDAVSRSVLKELLEDNIDTTLIRREIEELRDAHTFLPVTFRQRLLHALHSLPVQIFLIVLIILDVCVVLAAIIVDIFIDAETLYDSQQISKDFLRYLIVINNTVGCTALHSSVVTKLTSVHGAHEAIEDVLNEQSTAFLTGASSHRRRRRSSGSSDFPEGSLGYRLEEVAHVLHYIAIAILAILVLEVFLKIGAHGKHILQHKIGILDGVINTASLIIDVVISGSSTVGAIGKVIVVLTLVWQVFRILNAIVITSQARAELRIRLLKKAKAMHEEKLEGMRKKVIRAQSEIGRLCHIASFYGVPRYELNTPVVSIENDEDVAKEGIQASLFQLLRFNNAMLRSSSAQQPKVDVEAHSVAVSAQWRVSLPDLRAAPENEEQTLAEASQAQHFEGFPAYDNSTVRAPSVTHDAPAAADANSVPVSADCSERGGRAREEGDSQPKKQCETAFALQRRSWPRALKKQRMPCRSGTVLQFFSASVPHASTNGQRNKEPAASASSAQVDGPIPAAEGHPPDAANVQSMLPIATHDAHDDVNHRDAHATVWQLRQDELACEIATTATMATSPVSLSAVEAAAEAEPVATEMALYT